jgi:16S rRNA (adenine1518-N6/adenine1519-N6)-dimethyltransferase
MTSRFQEHAASRTPSQIAPHIAPRKELGQNFLRDQNIARNIIRALDADAETAIIEIGPGEGALTQLLLETPAARVTAVEYDSRAVELLTQRFSTPLYENRFSLVQGDIRKVRLETLPDAASNETSPCTTSIVGNIPYYITSDILFWIFDEWARLRTSNDVHLTAIAPTKALIMMQKEVAERIIAKPRTKDYGILSVASMLVATPKLLFTVAPGCFYPPPKITSAVVEFRLHPSEEAAHTYKAVQPLVRTAFNQRRKMLSNALQSLFPKNITAAEVADRAESAGLPYFRQRAEELLPSDFVRLQEFLRCLNADAVSQTILPV